MPSARGGFSAGEDEGTATHRQASRFAQVSDVLSQERQLEGFTTYKSGFFRKFLEQTSKLLATLSSWVEKFLEWSRLCGRRGPCPSSGAAAGICQGGNTVLPVMCLVLVANGPRPPSRTLNSLKSCSDSIPSMLLSYIPLPSPTPDFRNSLGPSSWRPREWPYKPSHSDQGPSPGLDTQGCLTLVPPGFSPPTSTSSLLSGPRLPAPSRQPPHPHAVFCL